VNTKEDILQKMRCVTKQLMVPGSQWVPSAVWLLKYFKISSFVFSRRK